MLQHRRLESPTCSGATNWLSTPDTKAAEKLRLDFRRLPALVRAPGELLMIDEELARSAIGLLGTAAAMLMEDVHLQLATTPSDIHEARAISATLQRIGTDVNAFGAAAAVLAQRSR